MDISQILPGFPNQEMPENFLKFAQYANQQKGWFCGCFELDRTGAEAAWHWFSKDAEMAQQFAVFGNGPDGSIYAFWLYDDRIILHAPIVYLDSEDAGNAVIANNFTDFLALLSLGIDELGPAITNRKGYKGECVLTDDLQRFREWLKDQCNIETPSDYLEIVAKAQQSHPNLDERIDKWAEKRFGLD